MKYQRLSDKLAIALSLVCVVHCLILPIALIAVPALSGLMALSDEAFHQWMLYAVLPISVFALFIGYLHHRHIHVITIGAVGLVLLIAAVFIGHDVLGEVGEVLLTIIGSILIAIGHFRNHRLAN